MIVTWDEALAEREQKGIAIGEAKGEAKATQEAILRLARKRHDLRNGFAETIRAIDDVDRLNEIFDRILDVDSLDDIDLS